MPRCEKNLKAGKERVTRIVSMLVKLARSKTPGELQAFRAGPIQGQALDVPRNLRGAAAKEFFTSATETRLNSGDLHSVQFGYLGYRVAQHVV